MQEIHTLYCYFGSSSFITNTIGYVDQHLQYLPQGELFIFQQNSKTETRSKFSAKELDPKTGYSYFGARYYDSDASIFISVDPMTDQRSWVSPYNYCQNNPIGRVDPTGALDGWVEGAEGEVFWDANTNSQKEFNANYEGQEGYSYVSDTDNPNSYTLPNGDGKVILRQWKEYDFEDGMGGPHIDIGFMPSDNETNTGWAQTFSSNLPDVNSKTVYTTLPKENVEERLDGSYVPNRADASQAVYFDNPPSNVLNDIPGRKLNKGAMRNAVWNAQSSMIINGNRSFTIEWGFSINSQNSGSYLSPTFINSPSSFHLNAINYLTK